MISNKQVRMLNSINLDTHTFGLGDYLRNNDFEGIEPFYSERIMYADKAVYDRNCKMIAELSKKLDIKCEVTFNMSGVGKENTTATFYLGEKIVLPEAELVKGKRLRYVDDVIGPVNKDTIVTGNMSITASYVENAYAYIKYHNEDRFNPYESIQIELNGNIPSPSLSPETPIGKKIFKGWYTIPQSFISFTLQGEEPVKVVIGSPLSYQPDGVDLVIGDVDGDGKLSVSDSIKLLQIIASSNVMSMDEYKKIVADFNEDGAIDVSDAIKMMQSIAMNAKSINVCDLHLYAWWE